ncbi:methyltransferase [Liquorilactobacillus nagelii DSM 13675]|nr:methyltransferase [Liquorilactobacillus nagelii DSM 13675]
MDIRKYYHHLESGHVIDVNPDIQADWKHIPLDDETFDLVVFDPPHLIHAGKTSWLAEKYGVLPKDWQPELKAGFDECRRVLKLNGVLIFKWNDDQIKFSEVLKVFGQRPILGDKRSKTKWSVFLKE